VHDDEDETMERDRYTFRLRVDDDPETAEKRVREALSDEGFGVLTEIDVQSTLKDKLGEDVAPYKILGACNPPMAHQAMEADPAIGGLLPCNVVVRAHPDGGSEVIAVDPDRMLGLADEPALDGLAREVGQRLQRVLRAVGG
jgi:uncharacterized protein (DUF302 family)